MNSADKLEALSRETLDRAIAKLKSYVDGEHPLVITPRFVVVSPTHFSKPKGYTRWSKKKRLIWLRHWRAPLIIAERWKRGEI